MLHPHVFTKCSWDSLSPESQCLHVISSLNAEDLLDLTLMVIRLLDHSLNVLFILFSYCGFYHFPVQASFCDIKYAKICAQIHGILSVFFHYSGLVCTCYTVRIWPLVCPLRLIYLALLYFSLIAYWHRAQLFRVPCSVASENLSINRFWKSLSLSIIFSIIPMQDSLLFSI